MNSVEGSCWSWEMRLWEGAGSRASPAQPSSGRRRHGDPAAVGGDVGQEARLLPYVPSQVVV